MANVTLTYFDLANPPCVDLLHPRPRFGYTLTVRDGTAHLEACARSLEHTVYLGPVHALPDDWRELAMGAVDDLDAQWADDR